MNYTSVKEIVTDIEQEVPIIQTVLENIIRRGEPFAPMLVFYGTPETKSLICCPMAQEENFLSRMVAVADAMHLYNAINASAVTVTLISQIELDNTMYDLLNIFVMNQSNAFNIRIPYSIDNDQNVIWHNQYGEVLEVDDMELDTNGKEMINMFYHYIHAEMIGFTPAEVLSYLACNGAAIEQFTTKYEYFKYSEATTNEIPNTQTTS